MPVRTLALTATLALAVAACGNGTEPDTIRTTTTTAPSSTEPSLAPPSTGATNTTDASEELESWLGSYTWVEFVEGDPGSDQTLVHELSLQEATEAELVGTLTQIGFQTFVELTVSGRLADQSVEIAVLTVDNGISSYSPGDVLFRLSGDPAAPTTTVDALATLTQPVDSGTYFLPGAAAADTEGPAGSIWAVDATTYDLILVDPNTGDVLDSVAGWGSEFGDPDQGPAQALQTLEVDARGRVWVDDCCEPAFGSTFGIDPTTDTSIQEAQIRLTGLTPRVAPSGDLVALAIGDLGVGVFDTDTGQTVVDPSVIYPLVTDADFAFLVPIAWADDTTLAVAVPGAASFTVSFVDLTTPAEPELIGTSEAVEGAVLDGDFRADGAVAVLVTPGRESSERRMVILDPQTVDAIEVVELPDGTTGIDYDATGRNLLLLTADGDLRTSGAEDVVTGPFLDAAR